MLNHRELEFLLFLATSALFVSNVGFAIAWVRARERALRAHLDGVRPQAAVSDSSEKLERAVDAIAPEVERISEGQRFVTRLLAERGEAARQPVARLEAPRATTPH